MCLTETQNKRRTIRFDNGITYIDRMKRKGVKQRVLLMIMLKNKRDIDTNITEILHKDNIMIAECYTCQKSLLAILVYVSSNDREQNITKKEETEIKIDFNKIWDTELIFLGYLNGHLG